MAKLKIKSGVKKIAVIVVVLGLFLSIGLYSYIKIKNQKEYEKTYDYKLSGLGYTEEDIKIILMLLFYHHTSCQRFLPGT